MAQVQTSEATDVVRHLPAAARVAAKLGGEHRLRQLLATLADALEAGEAIEIHFDAAAPGQAVVRAPRISTPKRAW